jgi:hypothetical protein
MDGVEIPGYSGKIHDVRLGHGSAWRGIGLPHLQIIKIQMLGGEHPASPILAVTGPSNRPVDTKRDLIGARQKLRGNKFHDVEHLVRNTRRNPFTLSFPWPNRA